MIKKLPKERMDGKTKTIDDLLIFGGLAIDFIWKWRNKVVHENLQPSMIQAQSCC